ncbi:MAG: aminotransferase class I/II-fold pyridoxal phosphate-dependent enzyme, partial [Pseudomonadota bacterium]
TRLTFPHNDYDWLERELKRVRHLHRHALIAVEGLYSMDGDSPDLARLISIKARHGAWLMVDEAHSVGVLGPTGRGLAEEQGLDPRNVEIWMGTLSKSLASCGGYIAGSRDLVRLLKYKAPGFVFSVGIPPVLAVAADRAVGLMLEEPDRVERLAANGRVFQSACRAGGLDTGLSEGRAISSILTGDSMSAVALSHGLFENGINALPVIYPAVPERQARVRFFVTARHSEDELRKTAKIAAECWSRVQRLRPALAEGLEELAGEMGFHSSGKISARNP